MQQTGQQKPMTEEQQAAAKERAELVAKRQRLMDVNPAARILGLLSSNLNHMESNVHQLGLAPDALSAQFVQKNFGGYATAMERVFAEQCFKAGMSSGALGMLAAVCEGMISTYAAHKEEHPDSEPSYNLSALAAIIKDIVTRTAGLDVSKQWASSLDELFDGPEPVVNRGAQDNSPQI